MTSRSLWRCALLSHQRCVSGTMEHSSKCRCYRSVATGARQPAHNSSSLGTTPVPCRGFAAPADAASSLPAPEAHPGGGRAHWGFLLLPAGIAAMLGTWQVGRYRWKVEEVEARKAGLKADPAPIQQAAARDYTRVLCQGHMQHERSILVGPRPRSAMGTTHPGYVLITPLVNAEWGGGVLVNRGWVPASWKTDAALRARCQPTGQVAVEGITRGSEKRSVFVPDNNPARGEWFWIDVPALAAAAGLPAETPLVEVINTDDSSSSQPRSSAPTTMEILAMRTGSRSAQGEAEYPIVRSADDLLSFSVMPADHRNYALTWFALAGATTFLAVRAGRLKGR